MAFSWQVLRLADADSVSAQTLLTRWGNVTGARVQSDWVEAEAGVRIVHPGWTGFSGSVKYLQRPHYVRTGSKGIVESEIEGLAFQLALEDTQPGKARLDAAVFGRTNLMADGVFFFLDLPDTEFAGGTFELLEDEPADSLRLSPGAPELVRVLLQQPARGVKITAPRRTLELQWGSPRTVLVRRDLPSRPTPQNDPAVRQQFLTGPAAEPSSYQVYLELFAGDVAPSRTGAASIQVALSASPDPQPADLTLDATRPSVPRDRWQLPTAVSQNGCSRPAVQPGEPEIGLGTFRPLLGRVGPGRATRPPHPGTRGASEVSHCH